MRRNILLFCGKVTMFFLLICVERVVGMPLLSSYFFWNDASTNNWIYEIVFIFLFCIVLSSLFSWNSALLVVIYTAIKYFFSSDTIRKNRALGITLSVLFVSLLFWQQMGGFSVRLALYSSIQILIIFVTQLKITRFTRYIHAKK